jgi:hypothetical protein
MFVASFEAARVSGLWKLLMFSFARMPTADSQEGNEFIRD